MPRKRSPDREKAFQMWFESEGKKSLRMIANELGIPEKTVSGWKVKDSWEERRERSTPNNERSTPNRKRGAPLGNTNSKGKGNVPPPPLDNKRALKTGEFERIFYSDLTPEEREMLENASDDPTEHIKQEVLLGAVREKRMMGRLAILSDLERTNRNGMVLINTRVNGKLAASPFGSPGGQVNPQSVVNETRTALESILKVEEALTRVQNGRQNAIVALHRIGIDNKKFEIEKKRLEFENGSDEREDDGFIAALEATGGKVFENGMDEPQDIDS